MKPFNVKGKGRHYKSPTTNQNLPSVTNILDCYPKQHALVHWSANRQKMFDVNAATELYSQLAAGLEFSSADAYRKRLDEYIGKQRAHITELEKAGAIGSRIHKAVEANMKAAISDYGKATGLIAESAKQRPQLLVKPDDLDGAALWAYMAFEDWWNQCSITPLQSEIFLYSDEYGYAGTTDLIAEVVIDEPLLKRVAPKYRSTKLVSCMGQEVTAVVDFKSGKGVYPDMLLQLAAYIEAWDERGEVRPGQLLSDTWGMIVRLPKTEDDPEFEIRLLHPDDRPQKLDTFLAVKKIWEDKHNAIY